MSETITENPRAGGSIASLITITINILGLLLSSPFSFGVSLTS
jgi:hypothetical protein